MTAAAHAALVLGCLLLGACRSSAVSDLPDLAARPPFPYSVFVTGGAFVASSISPDAPELARTYGDTPGGEAFPLALVVEVLRRGRVYVRSELDQRATETRALLAPFGDREQDPAANRDAPPGIDPRLRDFLDTVRDEGHDFLLVIEELQDGPIEKQGINGQWPVTAVTWLMVGLGLLIPDHTYESRASLRIALREVQTGRKVYEQVLSGGPVDLALVERTDLLGLVTSIVIPPFWVGDDDTTVKEYVRETSSRRLLESLARQLKSVDARERLRERAPARIDVVPVRGGVRIRVESEESLSVVRLRRDGIRMADATVAAFERELLASARLQDRTLLAEAELPLPAGGHLLQVLVQTVAGRIASVTVELAEH